MMNKPIDKIHLWVKFNVLIFTFFWNYGVAYAMISVIKLHDYLTLSWIVTIANLRWFLVIKGSKYTEIRRLSSGFICYLFVGLPIFTITYLYSIANLDNRTWGTRGINETPNQISSTANQEFDNFFDQGVYVKKSLDWQLLQNESQYITIFQKKIIIMSLFFVINLFLIKLMLISNVSKSFLIGGTVNISIFLVLSLTEILPFIMSLLYHCNFKLNIIKKRSQG